jgi:dihydroorotate dehydrogenase
MYALIRSLLFALPPETAHHVALAALKLSPLRKKPLAWHGGPRRVMGLEFANPLGLAAGLDKNGDYIDALGGLGFGFVEIGTVTPRPQPGNPRPRLFRLPEAQAIINRMGFNNKGIEHLLENAARRRYQGILGINIGKNFDTPVERAVDDYLIGLNKSYPLADYITVNISSPNTPGLRDLQKSEMLRALLEPLKARQMQLHEETSRYVPLVVKVAPDLDEGEIEVMTDTFNQLDIDGVIATNTTATRDGVQGMVHGEEAGGLSGKPLLDKSTQVLSMFRQHLRGETALIAAGGVFSSQDMQLKLESGADLVQVYSGFVYRGPGIVRELLA